MTIPSWLTTLTGILGAVVINLTQYVQNDHFDWTTFVATVVGAVFAYFIPDIIKKQTTG